MAVTTALVMALCGAAVGQDLPDIQARGVLRVIRSAHPMPEMVNLNPKEPPGLERELIEGFAALRRLKVDFVTVPTARERFPALLEKKGDVIIGAVSATEERRKVVAFTVEILPVRHLVVTRRPGRRIDSLEQLHRERVGTMRGSSWQERTEEAGVPARNAELFDTPEEVLAALKNGRVSAVVMSVSWAVVSQNRDPELEMGLFLGPVVDQAWAVRKDAPLLLKALDEYLANVRRSARWSQLIVKYFGDRALETLKKSRGGP